MRILLALDGSESSIQARDLVAGLPWPTGTAMSRRVRVRAARRLDRRGGGVDTVGG